MAKILSRTLDINNLYAQAAKPPRKGGYPAGIRPIKGVGVVAHEEIEPLLRLAKHSQDLLSTVGLTAISAAGELETYIAPAKVEVEGDAIVHLSSMSIHLTILDVETLGMDKPPRFDVDATSGRVVWTPPGWLGVKWRQVDGVIPFPFFACNFMANVLLKETGWLKL